MNSVRNWVVNKSDNAIIRTTIVSVLLAVGGALIGMLTAVVNLLTGADVWFVANYAAAGLLLGLCGFIVAGTIAMLRTVLEGE